MKKKNTGNHRKHKQMWLVYITIIVLSIVFLLMGPIAINFVFLTEVIDWHVNFAFTAGDLLLYYGAVLGGIVTCLAIITTIHLNNMNNLKDRQKLEFERAYEIYHKLPEILAKLELAAIHVQYSVQLDESNLIETLDTMKESESALREHNFVHDTYYNKAIEALLKKIINASTKCQENVEHFLQEKESNSKNTELSLQAMEDAFTALRETINTTKSQIMAEIDKFIDYDN